MPELLIVITATKGMDALLHGLYAWHMIIILMLGTISCNDSVCMIQVSQLFISCT